MDKPSDSEHGAAEAAEAVLYGNLAPQAVVTWLSILQMATEGAIAHLELHPLLSELLDRIRAAMQVDNASILMVDEDGQTLSVFAVSGPAKEQQGPGDLSVHVGSGVAGTIAASGESLIVDNLSMTGIEDPLRHAVGHALAGVPLWSNERVIGVLLVDRARPPTFTPEDTQLLQVIASRVSLAVEHAKLYASERAAQEQTEAAMRELRVLQTVSDVALTHARLDDLLHALLERIQQIMDVDNVAILLPTADSSELMLYSVHGPEVDVMGKVHVPMGEGVAGRIAATRKPYFVQNLALVPVSNPFLREHFRSLLGVPLLSSGRLIGVLHVDTIMPRNFTDDDCRLLEVLAERIAVAIDRARLYETAQEDRVAAEMRAEALAETTRRMDEFLSIASHELRTPLTSIKVNLQMLDYWLNEQRGRRPGEDIAAFLERAARAAQPLVQRANRSIARLDRLVADLLDASRIHESQLELQSERLDLAVLVRDVVEEQRQSHPDRTLQLTISAPEPLPILADADRIGQVMTNYIGNALKYSKAGAPVRISVTSEGARVRVAVTDEGVGIPEAEQQAIWDRFYRVSGIGHQSGSQVGLGLGLYISRDIIERHGGEVGVRSTPGTGSTFWFVMPLAVPVEAGERAAHR